MPGADRVALAATVVGIRAHDETERRALETTLDWIGSGAPLCRIQKPNVPDPHLVSYFLPFDHDRSELLLVAHRAAGLWLPPGGHVEPGEGPWETVERECREELGVAPVASPLTGPVPSFCTVTRTTDLSHTDVSLWYLLDRSTAEPLGWDTGEFSAVRWVALDAIAREPVDELEPQLPRYVDKLRGLIAAGRP